MIPKFQRISESSDQDFILMLDLYVSAFPPDERRSPAALGKLVDTNPVMAFYLIRQNDIAMGFIILWHFESFLYGEHFSIWPEYRKSTLAIEVLNLLKKTYRGIILFEVEPPVDRTSFRRYNFYLRTGFRPVCKDYEQPPYSADKSPVPMWILSNQEEIDGEILGKYLDTIKKEVYKII